MTELFKNLEQLPAVFASQAKSARKANTELAVTAEQSVVQLNQIDQAQAALDRQTQQETLSAIEELNKINENVQQIRGNAFSELIGLFDSNFNIGVQSAKADKVNLDLQKIGLKESLAQKNKARAVSAVQRDLSLAETEATIAQKRLANTSTQVSIAAQLLNQESVQRSRTLSGLSFAQLRKFTSDPSATPDLGFDIKPGDIEQEFAARQKAIMASKLAKFQMDKAQKESTTENIKTLQETVSFMLESADAETLQKVQKAVADNKGFVPADMQLAPGVVLPKGVPISQEQFTVAIDTQDEAAKTRIERDTGTAIATQNALIELDSSRQVLQRVASNSGNGVIDPENPFSFLPPEQATQLRQAQALMDRATEAAKSGNRFEASLMLKKAAEMQTATEAAVRESQLASVSKEQKPAMQQFLDTGIVTNTESAGEVASTAILNPNAVVNNPILSALMAPVSAEASKVKQAESIGLTTELLPGIPLGKTKKLSGTEFVQQVASNLAAKGKDPAALIGLLSYQNLSRQVLSKLAQINPTAFGGMLNEFGQFSVPTQEPGKTSKADVISVMKQRDEAAIKAGTMQLTDQSIVAIYKNAMEEAMLPFIEQNLASKTVEEAAIFQQFAGNNQAQLLADQIRQIVGISNQFDALVRQSESGTAREQIQQAKEGTTKIPGTSNTLRIIPPGGSIADLTSSEVGIGADNQQRILEALFGPQGANK